MDLISLILLAFAFKIYCEKRDGQAYSFFEAMNKINYLKSVGGIFGIIYVITMILGFVNVNDSFGLTMVLIMFNSFQVLAGVSVLSFALYE